MCLVSVSDLIEQRHRAAVVGLLMSMLSAGFLVGPIIGAVLHDPLSGIYACIACLGCTFVYTALVVKECAPVRVRAMKAAAAAKAAARGNRAGAAAGTAKPTSDSNSAAAGLDSVCVDESAPMLMAKGSVPFERSSDGEDSCSADGSSSSGTHHGTAHLEVPGASSEKVAALAGDEETSLSGWQIIIHSKCVHLPCLLPSWADQAQWRCGCLLACPVRFPCDGHLHLFKVSFLNAAQLIVCASTVAEHMSCRP